MRGKKFKRPMLCVIFGVELDSSTFNRRLKRKSSAAMIEDMVGEPIYAVYNQAWNTFNRIRKQQGVRIIALLSSSLEIDYDICKQIEATFKKHSECSILLDSSREIIAIDAVRVRKYGQFKVTTGDAKQLADWLIQKSKSEGYSVRLIVKPEKEKND
jgi:hypothetical protein